MNWQGNLVYWQGDPILGLIRPAGLADNFSGCSAEGTSLPFIVKHGAWAVDDGDGSDKFLPVVAMGVRDPALVDGGTAEKAAATRISRWPVLIVIFRTFRAWGKKGKNILWLPVLDTLPNTDIEWVTSIESFEIYYTGTV